MIQRMIHSFQGIIFWIKYVQKVYSNTGLLAFVIDFLNLTRCIDFFLINFSPVNNIFNLQNRQYLM